MRAIHVSRHGGPEVLSVVEIDEPTPAPDEVLIRVRAAGVNFIDTYLRSGVYPSEPPYVPGTEGSGEVVALGSDVTEFAVGDRVAWTDAPAAYSELTVVPAARTLEVPDGVSFEVAGSSLLRGLTAHYLLDGSAHPAAGESILVHAGAGGVGLILTQWAAARGVEVITTVSSDAKEALSREAGAAHVVRYDDGVDGLADRVRELTDGRGVSVVYDGVGRTTFDESLKAVAVRGEIVLFGGASGPVPPFDLQRLNSAGSVSVTRPKLGDFIADQNEFRWRADEYFSAVAAGVLDVQVGQTFPLDEAAQAHTALESRRTTGTTALLP